MADELFPRAGSPRRGDDADPTVAIDPAVVASDQIDQPTRPIRRWADTPGHADGTADATTGATRRPEPLAERDEIATDDEPRRSPWYEIPLMLLIAFTLAFLLRTFVVQIFYIPSGSMIPTLRLDDRIAIEKLSYLAREPRRGEVVVFAGDDQFATPAATSTADRVATGIGQFLGLVPIDDKDFVKRIIGLPGDEVVLVDGQVSVNGVELDEPYARLDADDGQWSVPDGQLFVLGDNRANSGDSRSALGYVAADDVVGRAVAVIWPLSRLGSIPGSDHGAELDQAGVAAALPSPPEVTSRPTPGTPSTGLAPTTVFATATPR